MTRAGGISRLVEIAAVLAATVAVACVARLDLALGPGTPTGGDYGSHYPTFLFLKYELLPRGRIVGWNPGNLAGYPALEHYFPLPFLAPCLLSIALPDPVAFKVASLLPAILLPGAMALFLRRLDAKPPVPAIGALASLCFLFHERTNVWGGNLLALFAGEFAFSWGLLFTLLFLAEIRRSSLGGRVRAHVVLLEVAAALSHGYAVLFAGLASFLLLASSPTPLRTLQILLATHLAAFLLLGAWILPLLAYTPLTTAIADIWLVESYQEYLPPPLAPVALAALLPLGAAAWNGLRKRPLDDRVVLLAGGVALSILLFRVAHLAHVVNIRFAPFGQLLLVPLAALAFGPLARRAAAAALAPVALAALLGIFLPHDVQYASQWARWNLEGIEARPHYGDLAGLSAWLRAHDDGSRVYFEHSPDHNDLGTSRVFESLPVLAGRPTLEGLYIEASPTAPYIYHLQSVLSDVTSGVLRIYHYAHPDVARGLAHLRLLHANHLVIRSDSMKRRLDKDTAVRLAATFGLYRVYEVVDTSASVWAAPLTRVPGILPARRAKEIAFLDFIRNPSAEPAAILPWTDEAAPEEWGDRAGETLPPAPIPRVAFGPDEIRLAGLVPGRPVRVAVSFHPRWRPDPPEAARVLAVTPSFLLVLPERSEVVLRFGETPVTIMGTAATILGLLAAILLVARPLRPAPDRGPVPGRVLRGGLLAILLAALALPALPRPLTGLERVHRGEGALLREHDPARAVREFTDLLGSDPSASDRIRALHWRAVARDETHDTAGARADAEALLEEFPESEWAPEEALRAARIAREAGDLAAARAIARRGRDLDPEGRYAQSLERVAPWGTGP